MKLKPNLIVSSLISWCKLTAFFLLLLQTESRSHETTTFFRTQALQSLICNGYSEDIRGWKGIQNGSALQNDITVTSHRLAYRRVLFGTLSIIVTMNVDSVAMVTGDPPDLSVHQEDILVFRSHHGRAFPESEDPSDLINCSSHNCNNWLYWTYSFSLVFLRKKGSEKGWCKYFTHSM